LAVPPTESTQTVTRPTPGWFSWPVLRWGTLAACMVVVGAAVMLRHHAAERTEMPAVATVGTAPTAPPSRDSAVTAPNAARQAPALTRDKLQASKVHSPELKAKKADEQEPSADATSIDVTGATPVLQAENEPQTVPGRAKNALSAPAAAATADGAMNKDLFAARAATSGAHPVFIGAIPRWTLSSNGTLQRSSNSGRSWETIPVPGSGPMRALSSSGFEIWVGGSNGALYHSSDAGQHWKQIQPTADGQTLTADIIGVEFTDSTHGTVSTASQETWTTADAGQTWQKK